VLSGSRRIYEEDESSVYELTFDEATVVWRCIQGAFSGDSGSAQYRGARIDRQSLLIVWSQPTGEAAVIVANLINNVAHVCHLYGRESSITPAKIVGWIRAL
jgi:hypothetical protein